MKDTIQEHYSFFRPVYQTKSDVKAGIRSSSPEAIEKPGKIVIKGQYLFLNDVDKGVHIIDIADLAKPKKIAFIHIPGCVDMAVKDDFLYADCYTDLVSINISDPTNIRVSQFLNGVFPHRYYGAFRADTSLVIQKWVRVDTVVSTRMEWTPGNLANFWPGGVFMLDSRGGASVAFSGTSSIGIAGSMARFGQLNNRLYTVSYDDLNVFNTTHAATISFVKKVDLNQGNIETIFPYGTNLFIGAMGGVSIYSVSNPDQPQPLGLFTHVRSCDPVVAEGNYAYVTLRGNGGCGGFANQLDVLNVSDLLSPKLIKTYPLKAPKGLSKDGDHLLICDGDEGVKIFNVSRADQVWQAGQIGNFEAYDVIANNGYSIVVANQGIHFIDHRNPTAPYILATLPVQKQ
jgi:hypothetical protein